MIGRQLCLTTRNCGQDDKGLEKENGNQPLLPNSSRIPHISGLEGLQTPRIIRELC